MQTTATAAPFTVNTPTVSLSEFQTMQPGAYTALLELLATRALQGRQTTVTVPALAQFSDVHNGRTSSLLLDAQLGGLTGGVLIRRSASGEWTATTHT